MKKVTTIFQIYATANRKWAHNIIGARVTAKYRKGYYGLTSLSTRNMNSLGGELQISQRVVSGKGHTICMTAAAAGGGGGPFSFGNINRVVTDLFAGVCMHACIC